MGRTGTEVARRTSDVVLADDNFASLVEALVEGRGFWRNMRTGLGLLVGGNAGELGMIVRQPARLQHAPDRPANPDGQPDHRHAAVAGDPAPRRSTATCPPFPARALPPSIPGLHRDALHRGLATGIPSLAAYMLAHAQGGPLQGRAVGFASVITTQLAQTLDAGRVQGFLSPSVIGAVAASLGLLATTYAIPPVRTSST